MHSHLPVYPTTLSSATEAPDLAAILENWPPSHGRDLSDSEFSVWLALAAMERLTDTFVVPRDISTEIVLSIAAAFAAAADLGDNEIRQETDRLTPRSEEIKYISPTHLGQASAHFRENLYWILVAAHGARLGNLVESRARAFASIQAAKRH